MTTENMLALTFEASAVRIIDESDELSFVASDVASILGYRDAEKMTRLLDDDEKGTHIVGTPGGRQEMTIISESGLYNAVFRSRRPEGQRLRKWVTSVVLPTIRKTGSFSRAGDITTAERIRLGREAERLAKQLIVNTDATLRHLLYARLNDTLTRLGDPVPAIEQLGRDALAPPDILLPFWQGVDRLIAQGVPLNHARAPASDLALNLPEVAAHFAQARLDVRVDAELKQALRLSRTPRFRANAGINSALRGKTVQCWVFDKQLAP